MGGRASHVPDAALSACKTDPAQSSFDDSLACASLIAVVFGLGMMPPMPAAEASL